MERVRAFDLRLIFSITLIACAFGFSVTKATAQEQDFVTPGVNTNLIGVTPEGDVPDFSHKQQQEPSCIVQPSNQSRIMCGYNDLRASDQPDIQGDAWIGYSMSNDKGLTWRSGLIPGYKGHANSLNMGFGADASLVAIPGADPTMIKNGSGKQSPGLAVLNYIAGYRDSNVGVLAIQRFVENEQEDELPWLPEDEIHIIADGTSGRFIDKPAFLYVPDDAGPQGAGTEKVIIEGRADPVTVSTPTGTLIVAYAVFTGSNSIKVMIQESKDNGRSWSNATKLSESMNEVTGVSLTAIGQRVVAVWRRKADGNDGDAIMSAYSNNAGRKWSKGEVMFDFCPFDQPATGVTFRSFAFPWAANDGNRFWAFATDRRYATEGGELSECSFIPGSPGIYAGIPRIVGMHEADGVIWEGTTLAPAEPFVLDPSLNGNVPVGMQVMPSAFGSKGRIDVAWYDTRREVLEGLPGGNPLPLINDYWAAESSDDETIDSLAMVLRKADVWMTRLTASCGASGGCDPVIQTPVRVSRYPVAFFDNAGTTVGFETEAHLPNHKLYASGTLAFKGDYIAVAAPALRKNAAGEWIPNHAACSTSGEQPGCNNKEDIFVAWGDNRDVRIDYSYLSLTNGEQVPFTPPPTQSGALGFKLGDKNPGTAEPLVEIKPELQAVTESDDSTDILVQQSETLECSLDANFSRSRDANVYGAVISDRPSLVAPTATKPLGSIQRTFPLILNNPDRLQSKNFCLQIENQPTAGRASFLQLPSTLQPGNPLPVVTLPVTVPASSSASRAAYVIAPSGSFVRVTAYADTSDFDTNGNGISDQQEACWSDFDSYDASQPQETIIISDGNLFGSEYCSLPENSENPACLPVVGTGEQETHNISLALANLQSPVLKAPVTQALNLQAPPLAALNFQNLNFQNLNFQNLNFQNLNFQNLNFQNLNLQNLNFQNLNFQADNFVTLNLQNLNLQALNFQNLNLQNLNFQNLNFQADGFEALNFQNLNFQNLNFQNLNFQNLNLQAPTLNDGEGNTVGDTGEAAIYQAVQTDAVYYQDITYIVETDANVTTTYTADIALNLDSLKANPEDPDEAVVQLIVWTPNEYNDATEACDSTARFEAQVISAVTLKSLNLADVNLPSTYTANNQNPYEGEVSFTSNPGQPVALTVRIWATGAAKSTLHTLYEEWLSCGDKPIAECENKGVGKFISFGASAQSCQTEDTETPDGTDCLDNGNEKIFQDRVPPSVDPVNPPEKFDPVDFTLNEGQNELTLTWPITGSDGNPEYVLVECKVDGEDALLGDFDFDPDTGWFEQILSYDFKAGTNHVVCNISDASENTTTINFEIFIIDEEKPTITAPAPIIKEATSPNGVAVADVLLGEPAVSDNVGVVKVENNAPTSGYYGLGTTDVKWTAWDEQNNFAEATQTVTVTDTTAPELTAPADITTEATGAQTSVAIGTATATDDVGPVKITNNAPATYPVGNTTVIWTATDAYTNSSSATQTITVVDSTAPTITAPDDVSVEATGTLTIVDIGTATATDDVDASVTITSDAPASFPVGITTVNWTATDDDGNSSSATQTVTVVDTTGPTITAPNVTLSADYVKRRIDEETLLINPDLADLSDYDLASTVTALDVVEGSVGVSCSRRDGEGTDFHFGDHVIDCTASDGTYSTSASFTLTVRYLYDIELILPKGRAKAGSTIPIDWQYLSWDAPFDPVDSPSDMVADPDNHVSVKWIKSAGCTGVIDPDGTSGEDAGSSDFRYSSADQLWQFSWQTPSLPGDYILTISPPGTLLVPGQPLPNSSACVVLR